MTSERNRFLADAFHKIAVGRNDISLMIDNATAEHRSKVFLADCHADCVSESLAERAGGGLNSGRVAELRVACGDRAELPEPLDLIDRHCFVSGQIE